jgi:hypothetical protein
LECRSDGSLDIENKLVKHDTQDTAAPEDTAPEDTAPEDDCTDPADYSRDGTVDESCFNSQVLPAPTHAAVSSPALEAACAEVGEMTAVANSHSIADLPVYMAVLDGTSAGRAESTRLDTDWMDWSIRYGSNHTASPGNFSPSTPWPTFTNQGNHGATCNSAGICE